MVVMMGAEEAGRLGDERAVDGELRGGDGELGWGVGDDVEVDGGWGGGCRGRVEVEAGEVAAGDQGTVEEDVERDGGEVEGVG